MPSDTQSGILGCCVERVLAGRLFPVFPPALGVPALSSLGLMAVAVAEVVAENAAGDFKMLIDKWFSVDGSRTILWSSAQVCQALPLPIGNGMGDRQS